MADLCALGASHSQSVNPRLRNDGIGSPQLLELRLFLGPFLIFTLWPTLGVGKAEKTNLWAVGTLQYDLGELSLMGVSGGSYGPFVVHLIWAFAIFLTRRFG